MRLSSFRLKDKVHLLDLLDVGLIDETWCDRFPPALAQDCGNCWRLGTANFDIRRTKGWTGVAATVLENGEFTGRDPVTIAVLSHTLRAIINPYEAPNAVESGDIDKMAVHASVPTASPSLIAVALASAVVEETGTWKKPGQVQ